MWAWGVELARARHVSMHRRTSKKKNCQPPGRSGFKLGLNAGFDIEARLARGVGGGAGADAAAALILVPFLEAMASLESVPPLYPEGPAVTSPVDNLRRLSIVAGVIGAMDILPGDVDSPSDRVVEVALLTGGGIDKSTGDGESLVGA